MQLTLLGTGSPEACAHRASSGYLLEIEQDRILLDCGGGVVNRLLQTGRKPSDITHIFFTHLHSDHMMDYARLVHAAWDEADTHLAVFGPKPLATIHDRLFGEQGALAFDLIARTENPASQEVWQARGGTLPRRWPEPVITEIEPGFDYRSSNGWHLRSCAVPHAQPQLVSMAFRIDCGGRSMVYSGDAALCPELEAMADGTDLLLHWCYRMPDDRALDHVARLSPDAREVGKLAQRCRVSQLLLTHLRISMDTPTNHHTILSAVREHYAGTSSIAEDLMVVDW